MRYGEKQEELQKSPNIRQGSKEKIGALSMSQYG